MQNFITIIYFIILGTSIRTGNLLLTASILALGILIVFLFAFYKNTKKQSLKKQIEASPNTPIININKALWWEFEELPGFNSASAKRAVWIRKHNGFYLSKEDFYAKNDIKNYEKIDSLIYF